MRKNKKNANELVFVIFIKIADWNNFMDNAMHMSDERNKHLFVSMYDSRLSSLLKY